MQGKQKFKADKNMLSSWTYHGIWVAKNCSKILTRNFWAPCSSGPYQGLSHKNPEAARKPKAGSCFLQLVPLCSPTITLGLYPHG
jgi:hypothetical protein